MVSGTISLPSRGTFHHSLTVLIHYRSIRSIQAYQVVLADSHGAPRTPYYSGTTSQHHTTHTTTGLSPTTVRFPTRFVSHCITLRCTAAHHDKAPQPPPRNPCRVSHMIGLATIRFRSPLLTESLLFSLPVGTEMFHFPTFPPTGLYIQPAVTHTPEDVHAGFPHSDILVSPFGYQLHQAYRRFPRPSSALITKASTMRSKQLTQPPTPKRSQRLHTLQHKTSKYNTTTVVPSHRYTKQSIRHIHNTTPTPKGQHDIIELLRN